MDIYESGVLVAFFTWLWFGIALLVAINSRLERNLNLIGQRLSWLTQKAKPIAKHDEEVSNSFKFFKFLLIVGIGLPFILASWLYVIYVIGVFIYRRSTDSGAPQAVREYRWKMRNLDMTLDQALKESMKVSDLDPSKFEEIKNEIVESKRKVQDSEN